MPTIFVSHSTHDKQFVESELIPFLMQQGLKPWYSRHDIKSADDWQRTIVAGLQLCDLFLVVMTPESVLSEWVRSEVLWAFENRPGQVIPVLLRDCSPMSLHIQLPRIQFVDFRTNPAAAKEQLRVSVDKLRMALRTDEPKPSEFPAQVRAAGIIWLVMSLAFLLAAFWPGNAKRVVSILVPSLLWGIVSFVFFCAGVSSVRGYYKDIVPFSSFSMLFGAFGIGAGILWLSLGENVDFLGIGLGMLLCLALIVAGAIAVSVHDAYKSWRVANPFPIERRRAEQERSSMQE